MQVAIIPARGGSRRIPRKNIRLFHGKPIIAYSIEAAGNASVADGSALFDEVWVSTEDAEIAEVSRRYGAKVVDRAARYAQDDIGTQMVMMEALTKIHVQTGRRPIIACCVYATCPMLTNGDLERADRSLNRSHTAYAMSVSGCPSLRDAGYFYMGHAENFLNAVPLVAEHTVMVPIPCERWVDINTPEDWTRAEELYAALTR